MPTLGSLARLIRSKNAGPWMLTIDVMLPDPITYRHVVDADVLQPGLLSRIFGVAPGDLDIYYYAPANAIKISFPRHVPNGHPLDNDLFGGQQFAPLVHLEVPPLADGESTRLDVVAGGE